MEGLVKRTFIFGFILIALAGAMALGTKGPSRSMTEAQMEDLSPMAVGDYRMVPSAGNPKQSYKMDERTYALLTPYGIVSRIYQKGSESFDVVLIAGNDRENFHDPRICFSAQGWDLVNLHTANVVTKTRGTIPVTMLSIEGNGHKNTAAFFYRGPKGFYPSTPELGIAMVLAPIMGQFDTDSVFYRFMAMNENVSEDELKQFVAQYMDAAYPVSKGFF